MRFFWKICFMVFWSAELPLNLEPKHGDALHIQHLKRQGQVANLSATGSGRAQPHRLREGNLGAADWGSILSTGTTRIREWNLHTRGDDQGMEMCFSKVSQKELFFNGYTWYPYTLYIYILIIYNYIYMILCIYYTYIRIYIYVYWLYRCLAVNMWTPATHSMIRMTSPSPAWISRSHEVLESTRDAWNNHPKSW